MKIVVLDGKVLNPGDLSWDGFRELGELVLYDRTSLNDEAEIIERIGEAELVLTNKTPICEAVLAACPQIRYIGMLSTGYNVVDIEAAAARGIPVCNVRTYGTEEVAQHAFALLLEITNGVGLHSREVKAGRWTAQRDYCFWLHPILELNGKTMGIVGYGQIGEAAGRLAEAFGMRVLAYTRTPRPEKEHEGMRFAEADELWAESDVISLHVPLFPETRHLINRDTLAKMKDGAILINTSRGDLVDEAAAAEALASGKLLAMGTDVASIEPIREDNPLLKAPNCFITPHIAWAPRAARGRLMQTACDNLRVFLAGGLQNCVNGVERA